MNHSPYPNLQPIIDRLFYLPRLLSRLAREFFRKGR